MRALTLALAALALAGCGGAPRVPPDVRAGAPTAAAAIETTAPTALAAVATAAPAVLATLPSAVPADLLAAAVGVPFEVPLGGSFAVGDTGVTVGFSAVPEDSRCPDGVQCLWQGRAVVSVEVVDGDAAIESFTLAIPGDLTPDAPEAHAVGPYTLRLLDLAPYPAAPGGSPGPYVATLVLEGP